MIKVHSSTIKAYYQLTKPGIIKGNLLSMIGGFLLASGGTFRLSVFIASVTGTALIIASACVINNIIDRGIDAKMARTKTRALVSGAISPVQATIYGTALGGLGICLLVLYVNLLTAVLGLIAFVSYVALYGYVKRHSAYGTLVGAIPGSIPPVAGCAAATNQLGLLAVLLFIVLACWQMAHFYAIAIFRLKEYRAAGIPVLPIVKGVASTKRQIIIYIALFIAGSLTLSVLRFTGLTYTLLVAAAGLWWLHGSIKYLSRQKDDQWARAVFGRSLLVLLVFCLSISFNAWLP
jgi:protoheme IX farnesyltransferase